MAVVAAVAAFVAAKVPDAAVVAIAITAVVVVAIAVVFAGDEEGKGSPC